MNFSIEKAPLIENLDNRSRMAYYTTPRFTILPRLFNIYPECNFIVSDIDVEIVKSLDGFLDFCKDYDFALSSGVGTQKHYYQWTRVSAGLAYFSTSSVSKDYVNFISKYIIQTFNFEKNSKNWLIDQVALWKGLLALNLEGNKPNVGKINLGMLLNLAQNHPGGKKAFIQDKSIE